MFDDDNGQGSVFDRLSDLVSDRFAFIAPVRIIRRPETLTIFDYRPTFMMFLMAMGAIAAAVALVLFFFSRDMGAVSAFAGLAGYGVIGAFFLFKSTIREVYVFDKTNDSYAFIRQFAYRKDVIEGSMSQFTGAYVQTVRNDGNDSYFVVLKQEGMFLTGVTEQTLREEVPIFNSFDRESDIADAIEEFLVEKVSKKVEV